MDENSLLNSSSLPLQDVRTRSAHVIPKSGDGVFAPTGHISLHHPGYEDKQLSLLFTLPACSMNIHGKACAEFLVALHGCYAIAIERPGFFTRHRSRESSPVPFGEGLEEGDYWYHLDEEELNYATLLSARDWVYTPEKVPRIWKEAVPWRGVEDDDQMEGHCCITGSDGGVEQAHLVEQKEWQWWVDNNMADHAAEAGASRGAATIGQEMMVPGNFVALSDNLHRLWDNGFFALFPLVDEHGSWRLHCVFLKQMENNVRAHHRRPLRGGLRRTSPACAWARFVFAICQRYESTFLAKSVKRYLGGTKVLAKEVEGATVLRQRQDRIRNTSPKKKSRSGSPRKRDRSPPDEEERDSWIDLVGDAGSPSDSAIEVSPHRGRLQTRAMDQQRAAGEVSNKRRRVHVEELEVPSR